MEIEEVTKRFMKDAIEHKVMEKHNELSPGLLLVQLYFLSGMNMEVALEMFESVKSRAEALKLGVSSKVILEEVMKDFEWKGE